MMLTNAQFVKSKRSKLCLGLIQILEIPEEDDFRLLQGIGFIHSLQIKNVHVYVTSQKIPQK